jgi:hypothetical protein
MRAILGISLLLLGIGSCLCEMEGPAPTRVSVENSLTWVRTVDGWEPADRWQVDAAPPPRLHPLVVACGQGLVSLFALVAFQGDSKSCQCRR